MAPQVDPTPYNNREGLLDIITPAAMNDSARQMLALIRRKPYSLELRQRGKAAKMAKPRKIRRMKLNGASWSNG